MQKLMIGMFVLAFVLVASPALASNSYQPVDGKCNDGDLVVYHRITMLPESCLPKADVDKARADAVKYTPGYTGNLITVARGQLLLTTFGFIDTCPVWFPMDCVIDPKLFVAWR